MSDISVSRCVSEPCFVLLYACDFTVISMSFCPGDAAVSRKYGIERPD